MFKKNLKIIIFFIVTLYINSIGKLLFLFSKQYARLHVKLLHCLDWRLSQKIPSSYKHEINLYSWRYEPSQVQFAEGGVLARMLMQQNDNVLDICCGDGSYTYLFFSDIAKNIDAIDYDPNIIKYAKNNYSQTNINYINTDLMKFEFKKDYYDVIVWTAGVAYFLKPERHLIFEKIFHSLKENGNFFIRTPLEEKISFGAQQKEVITDETDFEREFTEIWDISFKQKTYYAQRTNLNYVLVKKMIV